MEQLSLSVSVVLPLLITMAVGVLLRVLKVISSDGFLQMNRIVFNIGIPALVFNSIVTSDLAAVSDLKFTLWNIGSITVMFLILLLIVPLCEKDPKRRGVIIQGMLRSNDAVFGLAVAQAILGADHLVTMTYAIAITVPLFNGIGVIALELFRSGKINVWRILLNLIKNPIIIATLLGLLINLTGVTLPNIILKPVKMFSQMCTPLAFIVLGGVLTLKSTLANRGTLALSVLVKLIVIPLVAGGLSYLVGFRGEQLLALFIIYAAPTAMSSFPLACALDCDHELAGEIVAVTTVFSLPTIFIFLTLFGGLI